MIPEIDYHMHTPLCGHAIGAPAEYVQEAIKAGLKEIGFSDHAPMVNRDAPGITMNMNQLPDYQHMIEEVQFQFKSQLRIKIALEADYLPGYEQKTKKMLEGYPYDYVIGSVHFINEWGFDNPEERAGWDQNDVNQVYRAYYGLLRKSAQSRMFDIMGHVDLVKKFGNRASEDMTEEVKKTAEVFRTSGVAIEINTSGLRKPVNEMYPAPEFLRFYCMAGVPLTFGSDAHDPKDVGGDFDKAIILAKSAGYQGYVLFKNRKIERTIKLT